MTTDTTAAAYVLRQAESTAADLDRALGAIIAEATRMRAALLEGYTPHAGMSNYSPVLGHEAARVEGAAQRLQTLRDVAPAAGVQDGPWVAALHAGAASA